MKIYNSLYKHSLFFKHFTNFDVCEILKREIMQILQLNLDYVKGFITQNELDAFLSEANKMNLKLEQRTGKGKEFLGWLEQPSTISSENIKQIENIANDLKSKSDILIVIGIGGSYLGSKATISALSHFFTHPNVIYAGINLNELYLAQLIEFVRDRDFALCVISKSGTTLEPAIAFRQLRKLAYEKYGNKAKERIVVITNTQKGSLLNLAKRDGYQILPIPEDIGGRYSIFTPAGLLPIAYAGINIEDLIDGARIMQIHTMAENKNNLAEQYAAVRNILYKKGFNLEILVSYSMNLGFLQTWWQQLFGESEGKDGKGIFPATAQFTTDLHSLGQFIQQGTRQIFETVLVNRNEINLIRIDEEHDNFDGLNYLAGKTVEQINFKAFEATVKAHVDGGVPNIILEMSMINEFSLGQIFYFFMRSCGISGYLLNVNPFDQPGVEFYKKNMFRLLNNPDR